MHSTRAIGGWIRGSDRRAYADARPRDVAAIGLGWPIGRNSPFFEFMAAAEGRGEGAERDHGERHHEDHGVRERLWESFLHSRSINLSNLPTEGVNSAVRYTEQRRPSIQPSLLDARLGIRRRGLGTGTGAEESVAPSRPSSSVAPFQASSSASSSSAPPFLSSSLDSPRSSDDGALRQLPPVCETEVSPLGPALGGFSTTAGAQTHGGATARSRSHSRRRGPQAPQPED